MNATMQNNNYRSYIDGLRAIAIIAVIINHTIPHLAPSGFLGVDIFFAISGFVITTSLLNRKPSSLGDLVLPFYKRRIKRLLPALLLCIFVTSLLFSLFSPDPDWDLWSAIYAVFGFSNLYFLNSLTDYFSPTSELSPFLHTWSLGVEEQFYFIYPLMFWIALRRQRLTTIILASLGFALAVAVAAAKIRTTSALGFLPEKVRSLGASPFLILLAMTAVLLALHSRAKSSQQSNVFTVLKFSLSISSMLSLFWFVLMSITDPLSAYFSTASRFWEIGAGCLLGLHLDQSKQTYIVNQEQNRSHSLLNSALSAASLAAMICCFFLPANWKIVSTPIMIGATLTMIGATKEKRPANNAVGNILQHRAMIWIGLLSYSLYLWHWPLLVLARWTIGLHWWSVFLIAIGTLLVGMASYYWLESPMRRSQWIGNDPIQISLGLAAQTITAGSIFTLVSHSSNPLYTGSGAKVSARLESLALGQTQLTVRNCGGEVSRAFKQCVIPPQSGANSIILLGDSHAGHLYPAMEEILNQTGFGLKTYNTAGNSHQPFPTIDLGKGTAYLNSLPPKAAQINAFFASTFSKTNPGDIYIIASDWPRYFDISDLSHDDRFKRWQHKLAILASNLREHRAEVVVIAPLPRFNSGGGLNCDRQWFRPWLPTSCKSSIRYSEFKARNNALLKSLRHVASSQKNVKVYDPLPLFCHKEEDICANGNGSATYFIDSNHLSAASARLVARDMLDFLKANGLLESKVATAKRGINP